MNEKKSKILKPKTESIRPKTKILTSHLFKGSRKDLINVVLYLKKELKLNSYKKVMSQIKEKIDKNYYISYKKHLSGVNHHKNLGPARRPKKTYIYIYEVLKNFRWEFSNLKNYSLSRIIINYSNKKRLGGAIIKSRGRAYPKDNRQFYLKFFINYE